MVKVPNVTGFYDDKTSTISYVVACPESGRAAIVDSVLDYNPHAGRTDTESSDAIIDHVQKRDLSVQWILDTHAHADHLSAAPAIKRALGGTIAIGRHIREIQETWKGIYNLESDFPVDGSQFDHLFEEDEAFRVGEIDARALYTPGHTPDSVTYAIGDAAFVGDSLFMPDYGTARCDFPGGDAAVLYRSIRRIFELPPETRLFMCHDYQPGGRDLAYETTVAAQRAQNIHVADGITEEEFVALRVARDAKLGTPVLLLPAVQVNIRAGNWPPPESNGQVYLKIPVDAI